MLPARRTDQAEHQLHQRGLAGAVVADQRHALARCRLKDRRRAPPDLAVALGDVPISIDRQVISPPPHCEAVSSTAPEVPASRRAAAADQGAAVDDAARRRAGNCACAQRMTCTAGLFSSSLAGGAGPEHLVDQVVRAGRPRRRCRRRSGRTPDCRSSSCRARRSTSRGSACRHT